MEHFRGHRLRSGETSSNLALRFKSPKRQELVLHILREAGVEIDVKFEISSTSSESFGADIESTQNCGSPDLVSLCVVCV